MKTEAIGKYIDIDLSIFVCVRVCIYIYMIERKKRMNFDDAMWPLKVE